MQEIDFFGPYNRATQRDYVQRVTAFNKADCAHVAKQWGQAYWDGPRHHGYGGYYYDGRWRPLAEQIATHYALKAGDNVLDIGCGKAFLLYELSQAVPGLNVCGVDLSHYGLEHAQESIKPFLHLANATELPFEDATFDFVLSVNVLHNLHNYDLMTALKEVQRVSRDQQYVCVESYRTEQEKANLLYWQLTCESFYTPDEWRWFYDLAGYQGDYGFIFFE